MVITKNRFDHFTRTPEPRVSDVKIYSWFEKNNGKKSILFIPSSATIYSKYSDKIGKVKGITRYEPYMRLCNDLAENFNIHLISLSGQTNPDECYEPFHLFSYPQAVIDVKIAINYIESKFEELQGALGFCAGGMELVTSFTELHRATMPLFFWNAPARVYWKKDYNFFLKVFPNLKMDEKKVKTSPEPLKIVPNYKGPLLFAYSTNNTFYGDDNIAEVRNMILYNNPNAISIPFNDIGDLPMEIQNPYEYRRYLQTITNWFIYRRI